jgi:hypothetical protein
MLVWPNWQHRRQCLADAYGMNSDEADECMSDTEGSISDLEHSISDLEHTPDEAELIETQTVDVADPTASAGSPLVQLNGVQRGEYIFQVR